MATNKHAMAIQMLRDHYYSHMRNRSEVQHPLRHFLQERDECSYTGRRAVLQECVDLLLKVDTPIDFINLIFNGHFRGFAVRADGAFQVSPTLQ
jgi:hypothetical protein